MKEVAISTGDTISSLRGNTEGIVVGIRDLSANDAFSEMERVSIITIRTFILSRCVFFAEWVKTNTSSLGRKIVASVTTVADSVAIGSFTVGITIASITRVNYTISSNVGVSWVTTCTSSIGWIAGFT